MRRYKKLLVAISMVAMFSLITPGAFGENQPAEDRFMELLNGARAANGLPPLGLDGAAVDLSHNWSANMRAHGQIFHNPNLGSDWRGEPWQALGENVGIGNTADEIHEAFMNSPSHRANVLGDYERVGYGIMMAGDTIYVTAVFWKGTGAGASAAPAGAGAPGVTCRRVKKRVVCKKKKAPKPKRRRR